jgi:DNA polymerase-3 subunit alpha
MDNFVNLHVHSSFSLLDGALKISEMVKKVKDNGMPAVALTDHGRVHGLVKFSKECAKAGVKPIFGTEFYVDPGGRLGRDSSQFRANHLILLAKDNEGLKNLYRLNTLAWTEGFYYKPRIDWDLLSTYNEGLICLSACLKCELASTAFWNHQPHQFWETLNFYRQVFEDDYYLEIQTNTMPEQRLYNFFLKTLSKEEDIPLVLTCDSHYLDREHAQFHQYVLCLQTNSKISEPAMSMPTNDFFLHTPQDIYTPQRDELELQAARNTLEIAEKCEAEIIIGQIRMPGFTPKDV